MYAKVFRVNRKSIVLSTFQDYIAWTESNNVSLLSHLTPSSQSMINDETGETYIVKFY